MKKIALILTISGLLCVATAGQAVAGRGSRHGGPPNKVKVQMAKHHHRHNVYNRHHGYHYRPPVVIQPYYVPYSYYYYVPQPYGRSHGMVNYYGRHFSVGIGF